MRPWYLPRVEHLSNPAGRLYIALTTLCEGGDNRAIGEVIRRVYIDDPVDDQPDQEPDRRPRAKPWLSEAHKVLAIIAAMPQEVRVQVERMGWPPGSVNRLPVLEDAIANLALGARVVDWKPRVQEAAMSQLETVSHMLDHHEVEPDLDRDELATLQADVGTLIEQVITSREVDGPLRGFLLDRLFEIDEALRRYPIEGTASITKVVEATVGALNMSAPQSPGSEADKSTFAAFWTFFTRVAAVVTLTNQLLALETVVQDRLGLNAGPQPQKVVIIQDQREPGN